MSNSYKYLFFFAFFCLHFSVSKANTISPNSKLEALLTKAKTFEDDKKYTAAVSIYREALVIASELNLESDTSFIYKKIGNIYYKKKAYDEAVKYFRQSIQSDSISVNAADSYFNLALYYQKEKDSVLKFLKRSTSLYMIEVDSYDKFKTFSKAGILYKKHDEYALAMKYSMLAYKGFDELNKLADKAAVSNTIAVIQRIYGRNDIAETFYREALQLQIQVGNSRKISDAHNSIANIFKEQQKSDSAIYHYKKAISIRTELGIKKHLGRMFQNLGTMYYLANDYKLAEKAYHKAIQLKKETKDTVSYAVSFNELALVSIKEKQFIAANKYLDSSSKYLELSTNKLNELRFYEIKGHYFEIRKNYKEALVFQRFYNDLYKTIFQDTQAAIIQKYQEDLSVHIKDEEIEELKVNNSFMEDSIAKQKSTIWYKNLLLFFLFMLLLASIILYTYYRQQQKIKEQQLKLEKLAANYHGQEIIKESISKDLHDIISTSYDGIRLKILALSQAKEYTKISTSIIDEIKDVNQQIRLISHRLSPLHSKIQDATLTEIIVSQLSEFQYYRKIFVRVQLPLPSMLDEMKLSDQTNFYGIFLEALHNIEKHSQATEVKIAHRITSKKMLEFDIADNGIGFNESQGMKGIGLTNMKQRISLLNGNLDIINTNKGTTIRISLVLTH